ncbi:hypothetical protein [Lysobacter gummosus]
MRQYPGIGCAHPAVSVPARPCHAHSPSRPRVLRSQERPQGELR